MDNYPLSIINYPLEKRLFKYDTYKLRKAFSDDAFADSVS